LFVCLLGGVFTFQV